MLTRFDNSSYGIFHIDSCIRRAFLKLTETKEAYAELIEMRKAVKALEEGKTEQEALLNQAKPKKD